LGSRGNLELNWTPGLLLQNHRELIRPLLAISVEQRLIAQLLVSPQPHSDRPYFPQGKWQFVANQFALVPGVLSRIVLA
jgi:hypothetical protein